MKLGRREEVKAELMMTPMIDIVFQLLCFFLFSFQMAGNEGDFNIKMPRSAAATGLPEQDQLPPLRIHLRADPTTGQLAGIVLNERSFGTDFNTLRGYIITLIGDAHGPGSMRETAEAELDCDYNLRYEHVIQAVTAVSGYVAPDGQIVRLIEKLRFSPPKPPE
jgi:biopolymer transport protein ExbD